MKVSFPQLKQPGKHRAPQKIRQCMLRTLTMRAALIALLMKRHLLVILVTALSLTFFSGCAALLVGAAAGAGGAAYVQGELKVTEPVAVEAAQRAAEQAMKDLKLAVIKRQQDGLSGVIEGRTAGDQKVTIKTKRITVKSTEIRVRVGLLGDETMSRQILSRMQANY